MGTKYIVNNVSGQTITGDLTINGNLSVTGTTSGFPTYRALLTQTGPLVRTYGRLIIGETYTITYYSSNDDFTNVADVQSGSINENGCVFIATEEIPTDWTNGSELTSSGNLCVSILENTLGFDIIWGKVISNGGYYTGGTNPISVDTFPRNNTIVNTQSKYIEPIDEFVIPFVSLENINNPDSFIVLYNKRVTDFTNVLDSLFYTPIEIIIKD